MISQINVNWLTSLLSRALYLFIFKTGNVTSWNCAITEKEMLSILISASSFHLFKFSINTRGAFQQHVRNCKSTESKKFHLQVGASFSNQIGWWCAVHSISGKIHSLQISPRCFFAEKFRGTIRSKNKKNSSFRACKRISRVKIHTRTSNGGTIFLFIDDNKFVPFIRESTKDSSKCTFNAIEFL